MRSVIPGYIIFLKFINKFCSVHILILQQLKVNILKYKSHILCLSLHSVVVLIYLIKYEQHEAVFQNIRKLYGGVLHDRYCNLLRKLHHYMYTQMYVYRATMCQLTRFS